MIYKITHSNIAALQYVDSENGRVDAIYMSEGKTEAYLNNNLRRDVWLDLPIEIRADVNRQFGIVFSFPVEKRMGIIASFIPFEIEVN